MISLPPRSATSVDDAGQPPAVVVGFVQSIAVGRLEQQDVRGVDRRRIGQHGPVVTAEVAAEEDRSSLARDPRVRRAEQMARRQEVELDAGRDRHGTVEPDRLQLHQRARRVVRRVERQRGVMLRVSLAIRVARVFFLDVRRVGQHQRTQILRAGRAEHPAAKSVGHEPREVPAVVEVGVGQHNRVNIGGGNGQRLPVSLAQVLQPLEQPAVDEQPYTGGVQKVFRTGYRSGRSQEGQGWHP